jgi:integrase
MKVATDLQSHLPTPTKENPHRQLEWVFRDKLSLYDNKDTKSNYTSALVFYKRFLQQTNNYSEALAKDPRFFLKGEWDMFALQKVKRWIDVTNKKGSEGYLTSNSVIGIISALRQTMEHAYEHSYIQNAVLNVSSPYGVRETASRTAYSVDEYEEVFAALTPLIAFSKRLIRPYVPTGKGKDPRIGQPSETGCTAYSRKDDHWNWGWNKQDSLAVREDNLRWYFENILKCVPLLSVPENNSHIRFFVAARPHGGIKALYRKWGVSSRVDPDVIMPLLVELVAETGLNVESALSLRRDCFHEAHPLTGLPFLEYNKPRSGGSKELHTVLYDNFHHNSIGLKQRQSRIISNSINTILTLTAPLVAGASEKDRDYLFLIQSRRRTSTGTLGNVKRLNVRNIAHWTAKIIREHDLCTDTGEVLSFNLSRFRPTKITDLVAQGYDFFEIMAIAGHSSVTTTLSYIDRLKWANDFHKKIEAALTAIKKNKQEYELKPLPIAITRKANPESFVFKALVCHCKNPYDPPQIVRNASNYREGDACSYFNMCLTCDNVLITEMNLPKLIAYRNEIARALANVDEIPRQGELYKQTMMVLDEILVPGQVFSRDAIDWAIQVAKVDEFEVLDSFISRN